MFTVLVSYYGGPQLSRQNTIHNARQNKICHGKVKFITAKYNLSRQNTIHHGKIQFITAKNNSKQQIQITPGKLQTLTAKAKTIIAIQNSSRQEQNAHGKSKNSRQKQIKNGGQRLMVSGCPSISTWCSASQ